MVASRTPGLENALLLLEILRRIPRRRFTTSSHLLEQLTSAGLNVSRRSLQRHLDVLIHHFPLECDTRSKPYGFRWLDDAQGFYLPLLSAPEALLLQMAKNELADVLPARTLQTLAPLFGSAQQQLESVTVGAERRWLKKTQRIPEALPLLPPRLVPNIFETVSEALYQEKTLHLVYRNAQGKSRQTEVWPLGLVPQGARLYLVCRFVGYSNERIVALTRISQAQLGLPFDYPANFSLARYINEGHFGIRRGKEVRVSFLISKAIGIHLAESPLSVDQHITEEAEHLRINATLPETELLHRWLRGWGDALSELSITPIVTYKD